jgi:ferredoxin-NADP reductase
VHTPSGFKRQYSLVNTPEERNHLLIGVKLEPASRGGSRSIHDEVVIGQTLRISPPRNNFRLQPQGAAVLIAGGIGITPLLAMGATLQAQARHYELHYFVRSEAHVAFPERLHLLRHNCIHTGLAPEQTRDRLRIILQKVDAITHLYVCGPKPLIDLVIDLAAHAGIGEERVHYELFTNQTAPDPGRPFRVRLQRSGEEFEVPSTVSLAEALKARGIAIDTSCEQGVCGTCRTAVVDGTPEHRDLFLSREERSRNDCLMPCVSRSNSDLLVLDL